MTALLWAAIFAGMVAGIAITIILVLFVLDRAMFGMLKNANV